MLDDLSPGVPRSWWLNGLVFGGAGWESDVAVGLVWFGFVGSFGLVGWMFWLFWLRLDWFGWWESGWMLLVGP